MKTKNKILLTLIITFLIIFSGYIILDRINNRNFHNIINIEKEIHKNTLHTIVKHHSENLTKIVKDYGCCEQMSGFMKTHDLAGVKSDIEIISSFDMDAVWVYNKRKECLYNEFTRDLPPMISIPFEVLKEIETDKSIHYFLKIPKGVLEISGGTIYDSDDTAKVKFTQGYLLSGKIWDQEFLDHLSAQTNSQLAITPKQRLIRNASDIDYLYYPLLSFDNKEISHLVSYKKNPFLNNTIEFKQKLYFFFGLISVLILIIFYISFNRFVIRPLGSIINTLKSRNTSFLNKLTSQTDEFGEIATIIIKFFKQKEQLEIEIVERKVIEKNLRESEKKFRNFAELLPGLVCEADISGEITFVNRAALKAFGWNTEDLNNLTIFSFFSPEEIVKVKNDLTRFTQGEIVIPNEYLAIRKDGTTFPSLVYISIICKDNQPVSLRGVMVDITEIKNAEKEINKLLHAIEQSPNTIVITDIFGNIEYVNPYFTELTGFTTGEVIGKNHNILKSGKMPESFYKDLWITIRNGNTWKGEFVNKKKNNEFYWEFATISPVKDKDGTVINYIGVKEDITERKKLEQRLLEINEEIISQNDELKIQKEEIIIQSEKLLKANEELEKLSLIARKTNNAIVIFDNTGKAIWVNEAFTKLNGYSVEEFINAKGDNLFLMEAVREVKDTAIKVLTEKKTINYICQISTKYNTKLWIQTTLSPVFDNKGNVTTIIAIDSDITKIKEAEEEIRKQNEEIESQRDELEIQRNIATKQLDEIAQINIEIRSSIRYAENIQKAILPPKKLLETLFNEHFVLYIPKDIVSGDFYWVRRLGNKTIVAIADCTGHGVPGAFMSMLGIAFLNEIVTKKETYFASDILDELRELVVRSLHQLGSAGSSQDGMDMSLIILDDKDYSMQFAGANNSCYIIKQHQVDVSSEVVKLPPATATCQLLEINGDKMPVAIHVHMKPFKNNIIQISKGDIIYLFTDGFQDQFGGTKKEKAEKKFRVKRFKELIKENAGLSMSEQKNNIIKTFYEWKGSYDQTDDITVMGIKIE